jgi:hypothetical protein
VRVVGVVVDLSGALILAEQHLAEVGLLGHIVTVGGDR